MLNKRAALVLSILLLPILFAAYSEGAVYPS